MKNTKLDMRTIDVITLAVQHAVEMMRAKGEEARADAQEKIEWAFANNSLARENAAPLISKYLDYVPESRERIDSLDILNVISDDPRAFINESAKKQVRETEGTILYVLEEVEEEKSGVKDSWYFDWTTDPDQALFWFEDTHFQGNANYSYGVFVFTTTEADAAEISTMTTSRDIYNLDKDEVDWFSVSHAEDYMEHPEESDSDRLSFAIFVAAQKGKKGKETK